VAEINHPAFKRRAWTITADTVRDAAAELRREVDQQAQTLVASV
jgi:hypothetical protein